MIKSITIDLQNTGKVKIAIIWRKRKKKAKSFTMINTHEHTVFISLKQRMTELHQKNTRKLQKLSIKAGKNQCLGRVIYFHLHLPRNVTKLYDSICTVFSFSSFTRMMRRFIMIIRIKRRDINKLCWASPHNICITIGNLNQLK